MDPKNYNLSPPKSLMADVPIQKQIITTPAPPNQLIKAPDESAAHSPRQKTTSSGARPAELSKDKYVKSGKGLFVGQVRIKHWAVEIIPADGTHNPLWGQRCYDYWDLQRRVYGYDSTAFTMEFNTIDEGLESQHAVLTTSVVVTGIRPGARVGKPEWSKWKLKGGRNY